MISIDCSRPEVEDGLVCSRVVEDFEQPNVEEVVGAVTRSSVEDGGDKQRSFGVEGSMVDVLRKCFAHEGYTTGPRFGVEGSMVADNYRQHVEDGVVDVRNKRCSHEGCSIVRRFGVEGSYWPELSLTPRCWVFSFLSLYNIIIMNLRGRIYSKSLGPKTTKFSHVPTFRVTLSDAR